jgi:RND family efflux transporter MFP subunit
VHNEVRDSMTDKASLLNQLRIDRGGVARLERRPPWRWLLAGTLVLGVAVAAWVISSRASGVSVRAVTVRASLAGGASAGASLLDASGYVVARREATVSSKVTGKVIEVLIEEGQKVEKDQVIARLDDSNARATLAYALAQNQHAEASLTAARVAHEDAKVLHDRNVDLVPKGWISQTDFDKSKASYHAAQSALELATRAVEVARANLAVAQRAVDDTVVRAPFAGVVTVKAAQPGEMVSPVSAGGGFTRTGIGTIVDMDSLEVEVDVSENFIGAVRAGQATAITLNAYPDQPIPGEVIAVIPTADRAKATVKVRIRFKEPDPRLLPQMGVRVSFLSAQEAVAQNAPEPPQAVVVPATAVQANGAMGVAFVIRGDAVERRVVRLGARRGDDQVILTGIASGDRLAIGDFSQLGDNVKIRVEQASP